jgi:beta-glucosidase-like glycosyl hydrolase
MAVTANRAMQLPLEDSAGRTFLKTSQTTRHYMGYHQSNQMHDPAITVTERDLRDQFLPAYEAMQVNGTAWNGMPGGRAEAIMCSYAAFDGVPSCANKRLLQDILRKEWGSGCLVQSDCCDSISSIFSQHHYAKTEEAAVAAAFDAGTQLCFACGEAQIAALASALSNSTVSMAQLDGALSRLFLTRMRLGEFEKPGSYPHAHVATCGDNMTCTQGVIASEEHQQLVRKVAAASVVMAVNRNATLPILSPLPTRNIAVVGPFADCGLCYLHSYNGHPNHIAGVVEGVRSMANATGAALKISSRSCSSLHGCAVESAADAAKLAATADLVVAVVGLGNTEAEGVDRYSLALPGCPDKIPAGGPYKSCPSDADQNKLLSAVRAAMTRPGQKLVLVLVSAGPVAITNLQDYDAVLFAGLGGQAAGYGVADVMWGAVSPSARFPVTVYAADYLSKVGPILNYSSTSGVGRTYRYLDTAKSPPIFKFGFGLSYSRFTYSALAVTHNVNRTVTVAATVTNDAPIGSPSWGSGATEIPQLYVTVPRQPVPLPVPRLALQGFTKVQLAAQQSASLFFEVVPSQYCTVREDGHCEVFAGEYEVSVGGHQPGDVLGEATSNVVGGSFTIAAEDAWLLPRPDRG